jgi:hypothetical protein
MPHYRLKTKPRAGRADAGLTSAFWAGGLGGARLMPNGRETHLFRRRQGLELVHPLGRLRSGRWASALGACLPAFRGHSGARHRPSPRSEGSAGRTGRRQSKHRCRAATLGPPDFSPGLIRGQTQETQVLTSRQLTRVGLSLSARRQRVARRRHKPNIQPAGKDRPHCGEFAPRRLSTANTSA